MGIGQFEKRVMRNLPPHLFVSSDGNLFDTRAPEWSKGRPLRQNFAGHAREIETVAQVKAALRAGEFAFPGAYQLGFITSDGAAICFDCARREFTQIVYSMRHNISDGWKVAGVEIFDHGEFEVNCDHCGAVLCEGEESE